MKLVQDFKWEGSYVSGSTACAVVKYLGATDTKGSRWSARISRGSEVTWRATVAYEDGPIEAALQACAKAGVDWQPVSCHSIDSDTYAVGF
jgi:hypothetical protein